MTIENQQRRIVYDADGVSLAYPVPFPFLEPEWLTVSVGTGEIGTTDTTLVYGVDYEVTGAGDPDGGVVILATPQPDGMKLAISRWVPLTQQEVYPEGGKFPAETTEDCFDKLTMIVQDLKDLATQSTFLPPSSTGDAREVAAWMSEQVTAAENSAAAAATSEANAAASATAADGSALEAEASADRAEEAAATLPDISQASAGDTVTVETGPEGELVARWQPPSAGAPPQRVDTELVSPIAAGGTFTVPQYTVGGKKLTVYLDGVLCAAGAAGLYLETGASGSKSTTITINDALDAGHDITAIVAG